MSRSWRYVLVYLLLIQLGLGLLIPAQWLYHYRIPYEVFKEDPRTLDQALDVIARQIKAEKLTDYVIILGDSVGYSGPGGPTQSIGYYMEEISQTAGKPLRVFNLSAPAMQVGDFYVILLKLKERGIATNRVVINLLYGGFGIRAPYPAIAFWLADELRRLDPVSAERFAKHLADNERGPKPVTLPNLVDQYVTPHFALLAYRPVLQAQARALRASGQEVYDTRPWTAKPELPRILADPMYQNAFKPSPFVMSEQNPQVYFLDRIIDLLAGSQVLIYLTPTNQVLMQQNVAQPGYQENLARLEDWFRGKDVTYRNWEHALEDRLFADHVHLTPEGYQLLAGMLLQELGR